MFQLTRDEIGELSRSQFAALNKGRGYNIKYAPFAFTDYNDINEDTRTQLELINQTLAELQAQKKLANKPRNPIGFRK